MKTRKVLFLGILLVMVVGVFLYRQGRPIQPEPPLADEPANPASNAIAKPNQTKGQKQSVTADGWTSPVPNDPEPEYTKWYYKATRRDMTIEWKAPISFWGQVVDENGFPLSDAKIRFVWNDTSEAGTSQERTTSGENGLFMLLERRGKGLSVHVEKEGYYNFPNRNSFEYASPWEGNRFHPDASKPVVFRLKRMGEFAPLHTGRVQLKLLNNGPELVLDWVEQKLSPRGHFHVKIEVDAEKPSDNNKFGWRFRATIPGGGFLPIEDAFPFTAPESGYEESLEISMIPGTPEFRQLWKKQYYVVFGTPKQYGRIQIDLAPGRIEYYKASNFFLTYWINLSGSRNLEGNPKLEVRSITLK